MEYCVSCGIALPDHALFCGNCGHLVQPTKDAPTHITAQPAGNILLENGPTAISASSWSAQHSDENLTAISSSGPTTLINEHDGIYRNTWPSGVIPQQNSSTTQINEEQEEQEERRRRALILGLPLLGALADAQPSVDSVPMVSGTPQIGGVPMAQAPQGALVSPFAPPPAPYTLPSSWPKLPDTPQPAMHHSGTLPSGPLHTPKPGAKPKPTSPKGCALTLFILGIILLIIFASLGTFITFFPPAISLIGNPNVVSGGVLPLHGRNFAPGISVTLTLDDTLQIFAPAKTPIYTAHNLAPTSATALQLIASYAPITASATGTFDLSLPVSASWNIGPHTLRATEAFSSRSALLNFTIDAKPALLVVTPSTLDFGKLAIGTKATQSVVLSNTGGQPLSWSATSGGTSWLTLQPSSGIIQYAAPQQYIYATADTTHLKVGTYSTTLQISSNGGNTQVAVQLAVTPPPQAKLSVSPGSLDFGTLGTSQRTTQPVTISNTGTAPLNWKADVGNTSWLTLDSIGNTIGIGSPSQTLNVTANTSNLTAGTYTATLNISSNGGNAHLKVTLLVSFTASLMVSPSSIDASQCKAGQSGWACVATLTETSSSQGPLYWTARSTLHGVTFNPANDPFSPGQHVLVAIFVPSNDCTAGTFTFTAVGTTASIRWTCTPPPPILQVNDLNLSPSSPNCPFDNQHYVWNCTVILSEAPGSQGPLPWTTSDSTGKAIFNPASGTLNPNGQTTVTITLSYCNDTLYFSGPANKVTVQWSQSC